MVWFKVDDNLPFHPKVVEAGCAAIGLWVKAGAWSAANLTDGFIPTRIALRLGTRNMCYRLVSVGLFEERIDGFQFHDWDHQQLSKEEVEAKRRYERERKADLRRRQLTVVKPAPEQPHVPPGQPPGQQDQTEVDVPPGLPPGVPTSIPVPSRPSSGYVGGQSPVGSSQTSSVPHSGTDPPSEFCDKHTPFGTDQPCAACGRHRIRHQKWMVEQTLNTKRAIQEQARTEQADWLTQIPDCDLCDDEGLRKPGRTLKCDHVDRRLAHARGVKTIRETMGWNHH